MRDLLEAFNRIEAEKKEARATERQRQSG